MALLNDVIRAALDSAEKVWGEYGTLLEKAADIGISAHVDSVPSYIPGHPLVHEGRTTIGKFIALVADMRNSSEHLLVRRSGHKTELERVYYETSALLPALAWQIKEEGGSVTEYLGDGLLALFDATELQDSIYKAYRAGMGCVTTVREAVNSELYNRYRVPSLDLGVGLGYSQCVVHLVGLEGERHPKAIGKCVYYATKLSAGINEVIVDNALKVVWPKKENGPVSFRPVKMKGVDGFVAADSRL